MNNITEQIEEANEMYLNVESMISEKNRLEVKARIDSWTKATQDANQEKNKSLPPLVMSSGGIPKPLDPLFFKLKS